MKSTRSPASRRDLSIVAPIPATPPGHDDPSAVAASTPTDASPDDWEQRVREAAYRRFQERGETAGDPVTDWLEAEAELQGQALSPEADQRH